MQVYMYLVEKDTQVLKLFDKNTVTCDLYPNVLCVRLLTSVMHTIPTNKNKLPSTQIPCISYFW